MASQFYLFSLSNKGFAPGEGLVSRQLLTAFPNNKWSITWLNRLLKKVNSTGMMERQKGSGHPCSVWPPNSLDLNPVHYSVWRELQQLLYKHRSFLSVAELKQAILSAWQLLLQAFIDKSINQWRRYLECMVQQNGGHIERLFR